MVIRDTTDLRILLCGGILQNLLQKILCSWTLVRVV